VLSCDIVLQHDWAVPHSAGGQGANSTHSPLFSHRCKTTCSPTPIFIR